MAEFRFISSHIFAAWGFTNPAEAGKFALNHDSNRGSGMHRVIQPHPQEEHCWNRGNPEDARVFEPAEALICDASGLLVCESEAVFVPRTDRRPKRAGSSRSAPGFKISSCEATVRQMQFRGDLIIL